MFMLDKQSPVMTRFSESYANHVCLMKKREDSVEVLIQKGRLTSQGLTRSVATVLPLRYKRWLLKPEMSSLHETTCFLC